MSLIRPTRRELLKAVPALVGASALPAFGQAVDRPLNFLVIGDWGRGGRPDQVAVAEKMREAALLSNPGFIVSTGDNFYRLGVSGVDDSHWDRSFENVYSGRGYIGVPWHPVLGNHDYGGNVAAQLHYQGSGRWQIDPGKPLAERRPYYRKSVTSAGGVNTDLFFIDTVMWAGREAFPFNFLGSSIDAAQQGEQERWLGNALAASRATIKLVFGHHGIHSIGPHGGAMKLATLDQLLHRYGVTAYVHGHDHCLFHIRDRGMSYICSGGGSELKATYRGGRPEAGCVYTGRCNAGGLSDAPNPVWRAFLPDRGFASFDLYPDRVVFWLVGLQQGESSRHGFELRPRPPRA